jgi:hypothetical protein
MKNSDWDLDFRFGQAGEQYVAHLVETVEVKTDRRWKETGNLYIEIYCYSTNTQGWYPSGLLATKASHWAFNLEGTVLIVPVVVLKDACTRFGKRINCEIPPNQSTGFLITVDNLMESTKTYLEQSSSDEPCSSQ